MEEAAVAGHVHAADHHHRDLDRLAVAVDGGHARHGLRGGALGNTAPVGLAVESGQGHLDRGCAWDTEDRVDEGDGTARGAARHPDAVALARPRAVAGEGLPRDAGAGPGHLGLDVACLSLHTGARAGEPVAVDALRGAAAVEASQRRASDGRLEQFLRPQQPLAGEWAEGGWRRQPLRLAHGVAHVSPRAWHRAPPAIALRSLALPCCLPLA
mmetsp:Transcript_100673/g.259965  ORF Transcript_100673/g.259965 Transcript_100673/m.259965 type:complete len:213 (-) Transcript_100673:162-800(-)